ncbi:hypothetical protein HDU67_008520 [Dinochytrium kinnereticum]|nr:hypothetical protein HDU67_008520 [Dinochytrium kinnereticum]
MMPLSANAAASSISASSYPPSSSSTPPSVSSADADAEEAALKRRRITQACDTCNKKKIKCDGLKPNCTNCNRSKISCSYSRSAKKRGPRAGYIESLENRLKEMEALLQPIQPGDTTTVADVVRQKLDALSTSISNGGSTAHNDLVHNDLVIREGVDGLTRLGSPSGDMIDGGRAPGVIPNRLMAGPSSPYASSSSSTSHIPPEAIRELLDLYFEYIHPAMPLVHQKSFMTNFANESPLLLNAMYSLAARYSRHPSIRTNPDTLYNNGDPFYIKARELVDQFMETPHPSTVTALLCLATYAAGSGRGSASWMYSGMSIRMAQELKLNVEPDLDDTVNVDGSMSWLEKEKRRRTWWVCFILDRYAGAAADRSMIISEKDCRIYLPSDESIWASVSSYHEEPTDLEPLDASFQLSVLTSTGNFTPGIQSHNPFGYFVLLTKVFGKIIDFTNHFKSKSMAAAAAASAVKVTSTYEDAGLVMNAFDGMEMDYQLSVLDASLRNWYSSLPDWIQNIDGVEFSFDAVGERPTYVVAYLHIFYHTALILLYRPKMMTALRENPKTVQYSHAFAVCQTAASEVSKVVLLVGRTNPDFNYMTAFVAFLIFQSGLVHVMAAQVSSDPVIVETARSNVEHHVVALCGVSRYWFMAGRLHMVLKNLIQTADVARESGVVGITDTIQAEADRLDLREAIGRAPPHELFSGDASESESVSPPPHSHHLRISTTSNPFPSSHSSSLFPLTTTTTTPVHHHHPTTNLITSFTNAHNATATVLAENSNPPFISSLQNTSYQLFASSNPPIHSSLPTPSSLGGYPPGTSNPPIHSSLPTPSSQLGNYLPGTSNPPIHSSLPTPSSQLGNYLPGTSNPPIHSSLPTPPSQSAGHPSASTMPLSAQYGEVTASLLRGVVGGELSRTSNRSSLSEPFFSWSGD